MRIAQISLKRFKRFTDFTISEIPNTARLVIVAGPNGSGKSSLFDALHTWVKLHRQQFNWDESYHLKSSSESYEMRFSDAVQIIFHGDPPSTAEQLRKSIYIRTAYRNDAEFALKNISTIKPAVTENRFNRMIDNDQVVGLNYQRLVGQAFADAFDTESGSTTISQFRDKVIGDIRSATGRLFPDLIMNSLGNPLVDGTFRFTKGEAKGFHYKNLSGGEKAAFDLLLDMMVKRKEFDDTVFCIDEPEVHMNTRLQGALLNELYDLTDNSNQLWLATHSIGMMRRAKELYESNPGSVAFLDFGGLDFDVNQEIRPQLPTRRFWMDVLSVAFDDMAALICPSEIVLCEGSPLGSGGQNEAIDADCYNKIFEASRPETRFVSGGNAHSVEVDRLALVATLNALVKGVVVRRLTDRDFLSEQEISDKRSAGVSVLRRRNIEAYLFDDEILKKLCEKEGKAGSFIDIKACKDQAVSDAVSRGKPQDDLKSAAGPIVVGLRKTLGLKGGGNTIKTFMRDTLAPLVPGTKLEIELTSDIFT